MAGFEAEATWPLADIHVAFVVRHRSQSANRWMTWKGRQLELGDAMTGRNVYVCVP